MTNIPDSIVRPETVHPLIIIDAGHGGYEVGASKNGLEEKTINLRIAYELYAVLLKSKKAYPFMTRTLDESVSLANRANFANKYPQAKAFVSIHCNSFINEDAFGFEVYHYPNSIKGSLLASHVYTSVVNEVDVYKRGIKNASFQVLRETLAPAILVEYGFLSHPEEASKLSTKNYQYQLAKATAKGIFNYLSDSLSS